jgi:hypothetical protein
VSVKVEVWILGSVWIYEVLWIGRIKYALTHCVIICPSEQKNDNVEASHFFTARNIGPLACQMELCPVRYVVSKRRLNSSMKEL